ncbi:MAG: hypothetical protein JOS17DRAFT_546698 [Linnemannia elongata]|nr:MAG: hypothetical protein JOS17DRAFT_546698 [Linnemannia elongata]
MSPVFIPITLFLSMSFVLIPIAQVNSTEYAEHGKSYAQLVSIEHKYKEHGNISGIERIEATKAVQMVKIDNAYLNCLLLIKKPTGGNCLRTHYECHHRHLLSLEGER